MLCECIGQRPRAPEEHSAVPEIISRSHKSRSPLGVGLLREASHAESSAAGRVPHLNVSVAGFRSIRPDANHYNIVARSGKFCAPCNGRAIVLFIGDDMIGWEHPNNGIGVLAQQNVSGETDGRSSVAPYRLGDRLCFRQLWKLSQDRGAKIMIGKNPKSVQRSERQQTSQRLLDHGLLAIERQQLLGALLPAQGPEARAPATSENHGIKI